MKNPVTRFLGLFTRNWSLKLFALALAVIIYYSLKPAEGTRLKNNDRTFFQSR